MVELKDFKVGNKVYRVKDFNGIVRDNKPIKPEINEFEVVSVGKKYVTINSAYDYRYIECEQNFLKASETIGVKLFKNKEDAEAYLKKQELVKWLCRFSVNEAEQLTLEQLRMIKNIVDDKTSYQPKRLMPVNKEKKECNTEDKLYNLIDKYTNTDGATNRIYNILRRNNFNTTEDLLMLDGDGERIRRMRNCGETSARIIESAIEALKAEHMGKKE